VADPAEGLLRRKSPSKTLRHSEPVLYRKIDKLCNFYLTHTVWVLSYTPLGHGYPPIYNRGAPGTANQAGAAGAPRISLSSAEENAWQNRPIHAYLC